jgi:hypothetical protein
MAQQKNKFSVFRIKPHYSPEHPFQLTTTEYFSKNAIQKKNFVSQLQLLFQQKIKSFKEALIM